jgi:hypothetical protein
LSDRGCSALGIYGEVKCVPAKGVKAKKFPKYHEYESCAYIDWDTGECCNGVDEGTMCAGFYKEKCEAYEEYDFGFNNIDLISKEMTEAEIEQEKTDNLIRALSCGCEDMRWDDKVRYCDGLHPSCCKDCTKSKTNVTARIMEQRNKKVYRSIA